MGIRVVGAVLDDELECLFGRVELSEFEVATACDEDGSQVSRIAILRLELTEPSDCIDIMPLAEKGFPCRKHFSVVSTKPKLIKRELGERD